MGFDASKLIDRLGDARPVEMHGLVVSAVGLVLRATLPETWIGELCEVRNRRGGEMLPAEVVGFRGDEALLMPLGDMRHVGTCSLVRRTGRSLSVAVGDGLLGRVVDGLGRPIDGRRVDASLDQWPVDGAPPDPLSRPLVSRVFPTGVRVVDAMLTVGEGQRVGIFAGAGVGKSTLLGMIARNSDADVVVVGLVGERGREVREFLERDLGPEGLARAVAIVATSDQPAMVRLKAAYVATSIAEYFRSRGARTLLLVDSVTRFARARREVGLAAGEPPARGGFPPSVFAELPRLLERAGNDAAGSMTALYTVLVEGDNPNEPIASEVRSILDGHVTLSADRAGRGLFPAVDVARSVSRVMPSVVDAEHAEAARRIRTLLGAYERDRDLLLLGAYQPGSDPVVDEAAAKIGDLEALFAQRPDESAPFAGTRARLVELAAPYAPEADLFEDYFGEFDAEEDAQS
jgi:FliI/YscN family ATPase